MEEKEGGGSNQFNHVEEQQPQRKGNKNFLQNNYVCFFLLNVVQNIKPYFIYSYIY